MKMIIRATASTLFFLCFCLTFAASAAEVYLNQKSDKSWQLEVDGKPYFIRGVDYRISKIGESPDMGTHRDWAFYDFNQNGQNDGAYDAWVDKNRNNKKDPNENAVGDFELMRQMGVNTIRWYVNDFHDQKPNKELLRDLYAQFGIRVAVGNKFGAYTIDSGASWDEGTDYRNPEQQKNMLDSVQKMVLEHKDEPYTLLWVLGNENNLRFTNTNAAQYPEDWAKFLNEAARLIHKLDPKHPVAFVNGDTKLLNTYKQLAPEIDIFATNAYRGPSGFGSLWKEVKGSLNKPVFVAEYGGSYAPGLDEESQANYHLGCWKDIVRNQSVIKGEGNSLGGFAFEWLDEWWKAGEPDNQAKKGTTGQMGADNPRWTQEYCGLVSQGDGSQSPFLRQLRSVYYRYKELWGISTAEAAEQKYVITIKSVQLKNISGEWITVIEPDKQVDIISEEASLSFFNNRRVPDGQYINFLVVYADPEKGDLRILGKKDFEPLLVKQGSFVGIEFIFEFNPGAEADVLKVLIDQDERLISGQEMVIENEKNC